MPELTIEDLERIRNACEELADSDLVGARWERAYLNLADSADVLIGLMERANPSDSIVKLTKQPDGHYYTRLEALRSVG